MSQSMVFNGCLARHCSHQFMLLSSHSLDPHLAHTAQHHVDQPYTVIKGRNQEYD